MARRQGARGVFAEEVAMTRPDTKRTRQILIRVSADEDRQIRERAAALGLFWNATS